MYPEVFYALIKPLNKYESEPVVLKGYTRKQVKGKPYPGLIASPNTDLHGVVYKNIEKEDLEILHNFEGTEYKQVMFDVINEKGEELKALGYLYSDP